MIHFIVSSSGNIIGKRILDAKIATTPGRDRPKQELAMGRQPRQKQRTPKLKVWFHGERVGKQTAQTNGGRYRAELVLTTNSVLGKKY